MLSAVYCHNLESFLRFLELESGPCCMSIRISQEDAQDQMKQSQKVSYNQSISTGSYRDSSASESRFLNKIWPDQIVPEGIELQGGSVADVEERKQFDIEWQLHRSWWSWKVMHYKWHLKIWISHQIQNRAKREERNERGISLICNGDHRKEKKTFWNEHFNTITLRGGDCERQNPEQQMKHF